MAEIWDGYFADGTPAGVDIVRGEKIPDGLYHLVSEILVRHQNGDFLLMLRDPSKPNFGGFYESTCGGSALKGEDPLTCAKREMCEETGIEADLSEFEYLTTSRDGSNFFDHYCLCRDISLDKIKLLPGETDDVMWASFETVHLLIQQGKICRIIADQFLQLEDELIVRQTAQ